jgi:hypothetical protein
VESGANVINAVMKYIIALVYTSYETTIHDDTTWCQQGGKFAGLNDNLWLCFKNVNDAAETNQ